MDSMECPICFQEKFVEPISMSCGHFMCWPCFKEVNEADNSNICPVGGRIYNRVWPVYLSGSIKMTPAQLLRYGEREPLDFSVDPDQSISLTPPPPVSPVRRREPQLPPRRSSRVGRGTPGSRFSDYVGLPLSDNDNTSESGSRWDQFVQANAMDSSAPMDDDSLIGLSDPLAQEVITEDDTNMFLSDQERSYTANIGTEEHTMSNTERIRRRAPYCKATDLIEGTRTSHRRGVLQIVLEIMTVKQKGLSQLVMMDLARELRKDHNFPTSFPNQEIKEVSRRVKDILKKAVKTFKAKEQEASRSGQTRGPYDDEETIVSDIVELDNSIRLNGNGGAVRNRTRETDPIPPIDLPITQQRNTQSSADQTSSNSNLAPIVSNPNNMASSNNRDPVVVNRRMEGPANGRELREASLAAHSRHSRPGRNRALTDTLNALADSDMNAREEMERHRNRVMENEEEKRLARERRDREEFRQRELDRNEMRKDREVQREAMLIYTSAIINTFKSNSSPSDHKKLTIQFFPEEGVVSGHIPYATTLKTLPDLLRELKDYTKAMDVSSILLQQSDGNLAHLGDIGLLASHSSSLKVSIVDKAGVRYFKLF